MLKEEEKGKIDTIEMTLANESQTAHEVRI